MKNVFLLSLLALPWVLSAQTEIRKTYQVSTTTDGGAAIFKTPYGYAVFGESRQSSGPISPAYDLFMLRLDEEGNLLQQLKYGSASVNERLDHGIVSLPDGGWLLAGGVSDRGYVWRLNAAGSIVWTKAYPDLGAFVDIAALPDGGFVAVTDGLKLPAVAARLRETGEVIWKSNAFSGRSRRVVVNETGGRCFIVVDKSIVRLSTVTGAVRWTKPIAPPPLFGDPVNTEVVITDMKPAGPGRFALGGYVYLDKVVELYSGYYAALFTEDGEAVWQHYYNAANAGWDTNEGYSIDYLPNSGHFLLAGALAGSTTVHRLDENGITVDSIPLNISGYNIKPVVRKLGGYYVVTGAALAGFQNMNTFFYRSAGNQLRADEADRNLPEAGPVVFPNPASDRLVVSHASAAAGRLRFDVVNENGRVVRSDWMPVVEGDNQLSVPVADLPRGTYRLVLYADAVNVVSFVRL